MKKVISILFILLMTISFSSFSQEKTAQAKTPVKPALLVIDIQNAFLPYMDDKDKGIGMYYINALIELFRSNGYPVIRIYHTDKDTGPLPDTEPFEYPATVKISKDDPKVIKTYGDGFNKTNLDEVIKEKGSNTLFLCGLSAVGCVLSTYIGAQDHDYKVFMVKDALISHNAGYTDQIENIFDAISFDAVKLILEGVSK